MDLKETSQGQLEGQEDKGPEQTGKNGRTIKSRKGRSQSMGNRKEEKKVVLATIKFEVEGQFRVGIHRHSVGWIDTTSRIRKVELG